MSDWLAWIMRAHHRSHVCSFPKEAISIALYSLQLDFPKGIKGGVHRFDEHCLRELIGTL